MKKEIKHLTLPELARLHLKCVFCGSSNQVAQGGYFKDRFVCHACDRSYLEVMSFLLGEKVSRE